ncbi:unnamed protein product [Phytophthora lilii]|uniref:Unnamed protein product n=1 Tax=Phytophthora lilii TaxID=2077276 RepID=A0A9W7D355_9STRA|nr:unnamed protein product [Phytophthora lilii]
MAATLQQQQQQSATQQQQSTSPEPSSPDTREYRAEGITMPKFAGTKNDDVADYLFSAKLYFEPGKGTALAIGSFRHCREQRSWEWLRRRSELGFI